jgi:7-cyano-7-deazaguanine synthase
MNTKEKCVVLFSGGIDSTTCLVVAINQYGPENVVALTFTYGQKHSKEIDCAKAICETLGVNLIIRDLSDVYKYNTSCKLLVGNDNIEHTTYKEQTDKNNQQPVDTYVPFRNGLMLSYAAAIALEYGASIIYYGAHADDAAGNAYPDCSVDFTEAMGKAIYYGTGNKVKLTGLLVSKTKAEVVKQGLELNAPYQLTWSCYEGREKACGVCPSCRTRLEAFKLNGVEDPIAYE